MISNIQDNKINSEIDFRATYPDFLRSNIILRILTVAYNVFSIICFPLGILRLAKFAFHIILGYFFFMPSQFLCKQKGQIEYLEKGRENLKSEFIANEVNIKTSDKVSLNGILIQKTSRFGRAIPKDGPLIIHYMGQAGRWEDLGHYQDAIRNIKGHNILIVNYRGVAKSGFITTRDGLILDTWATLQYATEKLKVPKEKIILHGHSFGGSLATFLAANFEGVKLINDRSFSSLDRAVYHMSIYIFRNMLTFLVTMPYIFLLKMAPKKHADAISNFIRRRKFFLINGKLSIPYFTSQVILIVSKVIAFFLSKLTILLDWNLCPSDLWDSIKAKKFIFYLPTDEIIPDDASFFNGVKDKDCDFIKSNNNHIVIDDSEALHWNVLNKNYMKKALKALNS